MSRRPKLIKGNLYYLKMKNVWVTKGQTQINSYTSQVSNGITAERETHEYIAEILRLEPIDQGKLCIILSILASTQSIDTALSEMKRASTEYRQADGTFQRPLTIHYMGEFNDGGEYLWERAAYCQLKGRSPTWMGDAVFQYYNYNPKNLPLYLNWSFGSDWIAKQLQEVSI
jgi:hypothetical protein